MGMTTKDKKKKRERHTYRAPNRTDNRKTKREWHIILGKLIGGKTDIQNKKITIKINWQMTIIQIDN